MSSGFSNPLVGGGGALVYPSIHSPNFRHLISGWIIGKDGTAEFISITIHGGNIILTGSGGEFTYNAAGQLVSSNCGQPTTDPLNSVSCPQGFATYNSHGKVINLLSTANNAFFQYFDNGATQGSLILSVASTSGTDPVDGTGYSAGLNGIDPVFGDFLTAIGASIHLGQANYSQNAQVSAHSAPANSQNPNVRVDAPEQGTGTHMQMLLQGTSPDGTSLGQMLIGLVASAAVLAPVTNAMCEIQGVTGPVSPALQIVAHAAGDNSFGIEVSGDTFNRFHMDSSGTMAWGPGNATQDCQLSRTAANLMRLSVTDLSIGTPGRGLRIGEGANAKQGTAVLSAGSAVVANTSITANSRIFLCCQVPGGAPGFLRVSARTAGTSFTITSSSATDTSTVAYEIFEPG